eukprot:1043186-Prymnesium_polylepis.1
MEVASAYSSSPRKAYSTKKPATNSAAPESTIATREEMRAAQFEAKRSSITAQEPFSAGRSDPWRSSSTAS